MAAHKSTRGARSHARSANRPRTHPVTTPSTPGTRAVETAVLWDVARSLLTAQSVVRTCAAALDAQAADHDVDVATILRTFVTNVIAAQVQRLNALAGGAP